MSALDDILAKQKLAEDAYFQAGSPDSGPLYNAYIAALNAGERASNQVIFGRPDAPVYAAPVEIRDPETGKYLGTVPQPGGLKQVGYQKIDTAPAPVDNASSPDYNAGLAGTDTSPNPVDTTVDPQAGSAEIIATPQPQGDAQSMSQGLVQVGAVQTQNQPAVADLQFAPNTDWRVTLRLAPGAQYLYNAPATPGQAGSGPGILAPLKVTNGVVFPYTPTISTAYRANYSEYNLTHSNYRGYFYQNSYTDAINLTATFTAQSTADAAYVLAVIHFFRSVTKMFYGQDAQRGSPPPLVFLSGLGDYQFNNHPCLVSQFNYTLPADVDYISSGTPNNPGLNLQPLQNLYSTTLNAISPTVTRLATAFLPPGAQNALPSPLQGLLSNPTYVPSKLDIVLTLLPVQSRQQVSQQFSLKNFASGQLLKGGFW